MIWSTALKAYRAAGRPVVLGARPRGSVVHVCTRVQSSGRVCVASGRGRLRPVCGARCRRLTVLPEEWSSTRLGLHVSGRPLCRRCGSVRVPVQSGVPVTRAELLSRLDAADVTAAVLAARDASEYWDVVGGLLDRACQVPVPAALDAFSDARRGLQVGDDVGPGAHARTVVLNRPEMRALAAARVPALPAPDPHAAARDRAVLAFERLTWTSPGARAAAIRDLFGTSETRHVQRLQAIVDAPWAVAAEPVIVHRVRRERAAARARRAGVPA